MNVAVGGNPDRRNSRKIVKKDSERWPFLKKGFKLYLTGNYSLDGVNDILYKKGLRSKTGKKVPHSIIASTLKNPFYAGIMRWNSQKKRGKHQPMITLREHQKILQIMDAHGLHACRRRKHSFLLRGFAFCNICGQRYTAEKHPLKRKEYYHCTSRSKHSNRGQNVEVKELEKQVEEYFRRIQFSQDFVNLVVEKLKGIYSHRKEEITQEKQILYNQKMATERKRDKAEEKLLSAVISDNDFIRIRDKFKVELQQIQDRIDELESQRKYDIDVVEKVLKLSRNIYKAYKTAPYELKRQYLGLFWDKFLVEDRKIVRALPAKFIQILQKRGKVIIKDNLCPFPSLIITLKNLLEDWEYMASLREKLNLIKECSRVYSPRN